MNIRKLAALDMALHGTRLIRIEFAAGILLPLTIGGLFLARGRAPWETFFGWYLVGVAFNYVPLFAHAVSLRSKEEASREVETELSNDVARYGLKSLLLLLPLVVTWLAVVQALRRFCDDQELSS